MDAIVYILPVLALLYAIIFYLLYRIDRQAVEAFIRDKQYLLDNALPILTGIQETVCLSGQNPELCRYLQQLVAILRNWDTINSALIGSSSKQVIEQFKR